ncbi:MAG: histidinol-phosphatase HisJ [Promethearchaeota archaeon]
MIEDWHTHNYLCRHAVGSLRKYVEAGISKNMDTIGFSDHFPYEFYQLKDIPYEEYGMTLEEISNYISDAKKLKEEFSKEIQVRIGFEIDYMEGQESLLNHYLSKWKKDLDYIFGSIHFLEPKDGIWCLDDIRYMQKYEFYGNDGVYMEYFNKMEKMLLSKDFDFDIIAHFDLPKKFNKHPSDKEKIKNKAIELLELIKKKDKVVEINSGGFRKEVKEQYPSREYIEIMHELDIPILFGSDSHDPTEVGYRFDELKKIVMEIGYTELAHFHERKRTFIEL